jgi:hypothetical protein
MVGSCFVTSSSLSSLGMPVSKIAHKALGTGVWEWYKVMGRPPFTGHNCLCNKSAIVQAATRWKLLYIRTSAIKLASWNESCCDRNADK